MTGTANHSDIRKYFPFERRNPFFIRMTVSLASLVVVMGGIVRDGYKLDNSFCGSFLLLEDRIHALINGYRQQFTIYHVI